MASVSFQDVYFRRSKQLSLDINWCIEEGTKQVALIGRNGAGKSSLCRLLNGLSMPDRGRVLVNGREPRTRCIESIRQVGYMFQNPEHQMICSTVVEEIAFGPAQLGESTASALRAARDLLAQHQLLHWADWPVAELSHGQQKLLCLLAVLVHKPAVLVLDEPFAGMDLHTVIRFQQRLSELPQLQIVISHELPLLQNFERVCWLREGKLVADGSADAVLAAYRRDSEQAAARRC